MTTEGLSSVDKTVCPVCDKKYSGQCRCMGPHTIEDLQKGHGLHCENGHWWSYQANGEPLIWSESAGMTEKKPSDNPKGQYAVGTRVQRDPKFQGWEDNPEMREHNHGIIIGVTTGKDTRGKNQLAYHVRSDYDAKVLNDPNADSLDKRHAIKGSVYFHKELIPSTKDTGQMTLNKDAAAASDINQFDNRGVTESMTGNEYFCPRCQKFSDGPTCDHCKSQLEPRNESIKSLFSLIDNKTVTTEDFDRFIVETSPTSINKRVQRQLRPGKIGPQVANPEQKVDDKTDHEPADHNDPTSTLRGKNALRKRIKHNKSNPDQFREATEFLIAHKGIVLVECESKLKDVADPISLHKLISKLSQRPNQFDQDWLVGLGQMVLNTIN